MTIISIDFGELNLKNYPTILLYRLQNSISALPAQIGFIIDLTSALSYQDVTLISIDFAELCIDFE